MVYLAELFPTTTAASIFFVVYAFWLLSELVIGGIIPRSRRHGTPIRYEDRSSRLLISLSMFLSLMIAFLFAAFGIASLPSGAFYLGIGLMIAGILLRQWSIAVLGRYFSRTVGVQEGQAVVDRGPYRLVRHPAYTGSLTMVGLGFVLQSWGAVLVLIAFFGVAFGYRIHVEEAVLTSKLGDEYVAYAKKTKRLIPYVL